ncbi:hypothetical protein FRC12_011552 [Ceratobasidium sp. 428]|nr:hypothetical protein FRC12_011552 [Ceratobasidium sp. 428]
MDISLDALERMAGELGATVMVLREIVVPRGVIGGNGRGVVGEESGEGKMGLSPGTPQSGSGSSDEVEEAFSLDMDGDGDGEESSSSGLPSPQTRHRNTKHLNSRRIKLAQKAEHKRMRREVKRSVNAAYMGTSPTNSLLGSVPSVLDASRTVIPPALGLPEVIVEAPDDLIVVPFDPTPPAPAPTAVDADDVIIVEALVLRKLALEEAFLDFGGFSVLG